MGVPYGGGAGRRRDAIYCVRKREIRSERGFCGEAGLVENANLIA